jgi:hypothetical protein
MKLKAAIILILFSLVASAETLDTPRVSAWFPSEVHTSDSTFTVQDGMRVLMTTYDAVTDRAGFSLRVKKYPYQVKTTMDDYDRITASDAQIFIDNLGRCEVGNSGLGRILSGRSRHCFGTSKDGKDMFFYEIVSAEGSNEYRAIVGGYGKEDDDIEIKFFHGIKIK